MKRFDVNTPEDLEKILKERKANAKKRIVNKDKVFDDNDISIKHLETANLLIKVINVLRLDPMVKKVISMRLIHPIKTGKELSYLNIALELGLREFQVKEMENEGIEALEHHLKRTCAPDFIEKFNRDRSLVNSIKEQVGKSFNKEVQKEGK